MEDTACQVSRAAKKRQQTDDERHRKSSPPAASTNQASEAEVEADNNNDDYYECSYNNQSDSSDTKIQRPSSSGDNLSDEDGSGSGSGSSSTSSGHGRSGSGAPESPFSSTSTSTSDEDTALDETISEPNSSTADSLSASLSGRSSANQTTGADDDDGGGGSGNCGAGKLSEQMRKSWNLVPQRQEAIQLIDRVRVRFLTNLSEHAPTQTGDYEPLDLADLKRTLPSHADEQLYQSMSIRLISRFLNFDQLLAQQRTAATLLLPSTTTTRESSKKSATISLQAAASVDKAISDAADKLGELLKFRHQFQLAHVLTDQFSKEIYQLHGIFPFGYDKNQLPVLYLRARVHRRWSPSLDEAFKRYVAWQVDLLTKSNRDAIVAKSIGSGRSYKDGSFGICFDCLNVSYACVDMEFLRYLVKILVNYYPTYCRYALCVDLPWLFRSVWKLVRSWLPDEAQSTVHLITSKQLIEFIDEDQIPNSMKVNDLLASEKSPLGKHKLPAEFDSLKSFDELGKDMKLSTSEIKQFKCHVDKVLKEYEQLGAI